MTIVDRKYTGVLTKADGTVITDWIVFRAKDILVPAMLKFYIQSCIDHDCSETHLDGLENLLARIEKYQKDHPGITEIPDTFEEDMIFDATDDLTAGEY
jgi:hypothetical protein